ncbi:MAG: ribonuclease HI [Desulfovibrionaceae bacterium]
MTTEHVLIHTDGSCHGNPGPGGWCAILAQGDCRKELSGGFKKTTNNRMEILAAIMGLESLTRPCRVTLYTDSRYLCDAVEKNWIGNWLKNGWKTAGKKPVKNQDLWLRLIPLLKTHEISFAWVRGHSGHPENERCDELANIAASKPGLPADPGL